MAKQKLNDVFSTNHQIFDDLEKYLEFTKEYGYKYNEADLYDNKSYIFRQFNKYIAGKNVKNMWETDGKAETI